MFVLTGRAGLGQTPSNQRVLRVLCVLCVLRVQTENIRIAYIDEIPPGKSSVSFRLNVVGGAGAAFIIGGAG